MSVFTDISSTDCRTLLRNYEIGEYRHHQGLPGGVENSNFALATTQGHFIITLFERQPEYGARYTLAFMQRCRARGIPAPTVITTTNKTILSQLREKPVAICTHLEGAHVTTPKKYHCYEVGRTLALVHRVGSGKLGERPNPFDVDWRNRMVTQVNKYLDEYQLGILQEALQVIGPSTKSELLSGTIHADAFRDNILFTGKKLTGVVDFYYACHERFMLDLAVAINDWCSTDTGRLREKMQAAMLEGYASVRKPAEGESNAIPILLVESALRFWLSRLYDQHFTRTGTDIEVKPPEEFERCLRHRLKTLAK